MIIPVSSALSPRLGYKDLTFLLAAIMTSSLSESTFLPCLFSHSGLFPLKRTRALLGEYSPGFDFPHGFLLLSQVESR